MDILPFSALHTTRRPREVNNNSPDDREREGWKRSLEVVWEDCEWCLFTVDVRNTYGMPFEVTFERDQEGQAMSCTRYDLTTF